MERQFLPKFFSTFGLLALVVFLGNSPAKCEEARMLHKGLNAPTGMLFDDAGNLIVSEWGTGRVIRIAPNGLKESILTNLASPAGLALDKSGRLYIAGYGDGKIHRLEKDGALTQITAGLSAPTGIVFDQNENLLIANRNAGEIVRLHPDGHQEIFVSGLQYPVGIAQSGNGTYFVSCYGGTIELLSPDGKKLGAISKLNTPGVGIMPVGLDSIIVVDYGGDAIALTDSHGNVQTLARISSPVALSRTPSGNILVGSWRDGAIYEIGNGGL